MTSFDFFTAGALPAPVVDEAAAAAIAAEHFGLPVRARCLGSQQDANFLLTSPDGDDGVVGVLKVSNGAFGPGDIAAQNAAAEHLERRAEGLRVATTLPGLGPAASRRSPCPAVPRWWRGCCATCRAAR